MSRTVKEVDAEIAETKEALKDVHGEECEVYARIVGYYRNVRNWNKGKKEEFKERKMFDEPGTNEQECADCKLPQETNAEKLSRLDIKDNDITFVEAFFKTNCPNCPPVKDWVKNNIKVPYDIYVCDAGTDNIKVAAKRGVMSCPTVVLYNCKREEITRCHNTEELEEVFKDFELVSK